MFGRATNEDERIVSDAMREIARGAVSDRPLPDPSFIWWKAQLLRRFEAERQATAPLEIGDRMHVGAAVLGAVALASGVWDQLPHLSFSSAELVSVALGAVVLLSVITLAAIEAIRQR
jgi:hypothetical protein